MTPTGPGAHGHVVRLTTHTFGDDLGEQCRRADELVEHPHAQLRDREDQGAALVLPGDLTGGRVGECRAKAGSDGAQRADVHRLRPYGLKDRRVASLVVEGLQLWVVLHQHG